MSRVTWTQTVLQTTDADFRAWGSLLSSKLAACGLVKTADTGQIDWATALRPTVAGNMAGYEMWRFNDALQATKPIFLRVDYGAAPMSATSAGMRFNLGTATNGAGVLTGVASASGSSGSQNLSNATTGVSRQCWACHTSDGAFTLVWNYGDGCSLILAVDRSRDADGVPTSDGFFHKLWGSYQGSSALTRIYHYSFRTNSVSGAENTTASNAVPWMTVLTHWLTGSSATGATIRLYNWYVFTPGPHPLVGLFTYKTAEIGPLTELDVAMVGATPRHYLTLVGYTANDADPRWTGGLGIGLLWDAT